MKECKICKGSGWITFDVDGNEISLEIDEEESMYGAGYIFDQYFGFNCKCNNMPDLSDLRMKDD